MVQIALHFEFVSSESGYFDSAELAKYCHMECRMVIAQHNILCILMESLISGVPPLSKTNVYHRKTVRCKN